MYRKAEFFGDQRLNSVERQEILLSWKYYEIVT